MVITKKTIDDDIETFLTSIGKDLLDRHGEEAYKKFQEGILKVVDKFKK